MTGLAWNEMNIIMNVRLIRRTNISLFRKTACILSHMTCTGNFEITSSQRLNSSKGVVSGARLVATSLGVLTSTLIWSRRERQWRKLSLCPLDEEALMADADVTDLDTEWWIKEKARRSGNGEHLSILSRVFRIFGLDELVDLKVAE